MSVKALSSLYRRFLRDTAVFSPDGLPMEPKSKGYEVVDCIKNYQSIYNTGELSDITVRFSDKSILAHRVILSLASPYFRAMFTRNGFIESGKTAIELYDDDEGALEACLRYIYGYPFTIKATCAEDMVRNLRVAQIAEKYQLLELQNAVVYHLRIILNRHQGHLENLLHALVHLKGAKDDYGDTIHSLLQAFLRRGFIDMLTVPAFRALIENDMLYLADVVFINIHHLLFDTPIREDLSGLLKKAIIANENDFAFRLLVHAFNGFENLWSWKVGPHVQQQIDYFKKLLADEHGQALFKNSEELCVQTILTHFNPL